MNRSRRCVGFLGGVFFLFSSRAHMTSAIIINILTSGSPNPNIKIYLIYLSISRIRSPEQQQAEFFVPNPHGRRGSAQRKCRKADSHRCHRRRGGRCLRSDCCCPNRSGETHNPTATDHHLARGIFQKWHIKCIIVITSQSVVSGATSHGVANLSCHRSRRRHSITVERQCPNAFNRSRINSAEFCVL